MKLQIPSCEVEIDDCDQDILDGDMRVFSAVDLRYAVATRMALPDYVRLVSVDGNVQNCHRLNIASVPKGKVSDRMVIDPVYPVLGIRDAKEARSGVQVTLSEEDYPYITKWSWQYAPNGYVYRQSPALKGSYRKVLLHKVVGERMGLVGRVYFMDGYKLNCRRDNLTDQPQARKRATPTDWERNDLLAEIKRLVEVQGL